MPAWFLDSSALVKRYVKEQGSAWVKSLLDRKPRIFVARITGVEVVAAIVRRGMASGVPVGRTRSALRLFRLDYQSRFYFVPISPSLLAQAMTLAEQHGLRGYDAVQLAAATTANQRYVTGGRDPVTFICADVELNAAAALEGLATDDPNAHP